MKIIRVLCLLLAVFCKYDVAMNSSSSEVLQLINKMVVSPDGKFIAVSLWNGDINIINMSTMTRKIISFPHDVRVSISALAYDEHLVIGYTDGVVRIIDRKFEEIISFKAYDSVVCNLSCDGNVLATVSADSCVKVWDISTGRCMHTVKVDHMGQVLLVDSLRKLLFVSTDCSVIVINFEEDKIISTLRGNLCSVTACVLYNDYLWTCSNDGTLRKWNIYSGECAMMIKTRYIFSSLSISTNGQSLIGASKVGIALTWDLETGKTIGCVDPKSFSGAMGSKNYREAITIHNAVFFATSLRNIAAYNIGANTHRIPIINELNCSIEDIELYDKSCSVVCNQVCTCKSQEHICLDLRIRNMFATYKLCLKISGVLHVIDHIHDIRAIMRMIITQAVKDGKLTLMFGKKSTRDSEQLEFKGRPLVTDSPYVYRHDERLNLAAYTIGDRLTSFTLTDTDGACVQAQPFMPTDRHEAGEQAQQRMGLDSVLAFNNIVPKGPYILSAETHSMRYQWSIPFLSPRTEMLLTILPGPVKLKLYEETAEQVHYAPLLVSEPLPAQKSEEPRFVQTAI